MTRTERSRLASLEPAKLGETDLRHVTEGMHALRRQGGRKYPPKMGRANAIRRKCIDCCGGERSEVRRCEAIDCPLWPHRLGGDPYRKSSKQTAPARMKPPGACRPPQGLPSKERIR